MRSLALLLLLANISFLSWQLNQFPWLPWQPEHLNQSHSSLEGKSSISNLPQLVLLREHQQSNLNSQLSSPQPDRNTQINVTMAKSSADNSQKLSTSTKVVTNLAENQTQEIRKITQTQDSISKEQPMMAKPVNQLMVNKMVNDRSIVVLAEKQSVEKPAEKPAATSAKTSQSQPVVNKLSAEKKPPQIESLSTHPIQPVKKVNQTGNLVKSLTAPLKQSVSCFESGPYAQSATAQPLYNWLKNNKAIKGDIQVEIQPRQTQVLESTWVYLPPFKDRQAAYVAQQRLNQLGIADYMIVTQGQFNNAISLGRYRNPINVQQRLKELSIKGYQNIKTQERYKNDTRYWLNVKISSKESPSLLSAIKKHFKNLTLKQSRCELFTKAG
jgi:hypothetical protein